MIRENNERMIEERKHEMMSKLNEKDKSLYRVQEERKQRMKEKYNDDLIKRTDKKDNVERIMKVQEYEREKLLEKIDEKMNKADNIKREKFELLEQRQLMKK